MFVSKSTVIYGYSVIFYLLCIVTNMNEIGLSDAEVGANKIFIKR